MKTILAKFNWKYGLFIFIFIIICLEIFGRLYLTVVLKKSTTQKYQFDSYRIYSHIPHFREGDGEEDWMVINGQGFRRYAEVKKNKPSNTFRIFLMGGSAVHGINTSPPYPLVHIYMDETIDYFLEQNLKSKYPDKNIEVINAGVIGYQVFQHTPYLLTEILDYDPDLVIFMDGANDHFINNPEFNYYGENKYQFWKSKLQNPSVEGVLNYSILWMSQFSGFARGCYSWMLKKDVSRNYAKEIQMEKTYPDTPSLIEGHRAAAKKTFLRSIETNISILQANGVKVIVSLQPMFVLRDKNLLSKPENDFLKLDEIIKTFYNIKTLYPVVSEELTSLTSKYDVPYLDLNLEFNQVKYSQQQLLIDYCHLTPLGAKVIANRLTPVVDSILKPNLKTIAKI